MRAIIAAVMGAVVWVVIGYAVQVAGAAMGKMGFTADFGVWLLGRNSAPYVLSYPLFWAVLGVAMGLLSDQYRKLSSEGV